MSSFELDEGQRALYDSARGHARETLRELAAAGTEGEVNRPLLRAMGELGLLGRLFPGPEAAALDLCLLREALATESTEAETALALQGLGTYPVLQSGSPAQVDRWVPAASRGEAVAAFALTEPEAGSDAAALTTVAERDGSRLAAHGHEGLDLERAAGRLLHRLRPHDAGRSRQGSQRVRRPGRPAGPRR